MKLDQLIIKYHNRERENSRSYRRSKKWTPSSFGQCYRRQWYKKQRFKPDSQPSDALKEIFTLGNICEDIYCKRYPEGIFQRKIAVEGFLGLLDIQLPEQILEVKSVSGAVLRDIMAPSYDNLDDLLCEKVWKSGSEYYVWREKAHNVLQLAYYMVNTKLDGSLVFISRDSLEVCDFAPDGDCLRYGLSHDIRVHTVPIPLDAKLKQAVALEMDTLRGLDKCPRGEARMKDECGYCDYRERCINETGGNVGKINNIHARW